MKLVRARFSDDRLYDLTFEEGRISSICISDGSEGDFDARCYLAIGGAIDAHVHLRSPGFEHKETIMTGTLAAAKGGVTAVMSMPNLKPVPDCLENLRQQQRLIDTYAQVPVYPYGSVTVGQQGKQLSDMEDLTDFVVAFTDDGVGFHDYGLLREAMELAVTRGKVICSHAEAEGYGYTPQAEYLAVERELQLVRETGCKYHFCHLSTRQSFDLVRKAKAEGLDVTCEVTPHHLFLCDEDIPTGNANFKMNPPLRSREDMQATVSALLDGTADMLATDHAPHTEQEKSVDYAVAPNGIIGLETLLPLCYTKLVKTKMISVDRLSQLVTHNPARRFNLPFCSLKVGDYADITLLDTETEHIYTRQEILSKSVNSPFLGEVLFGMPAATFVRGELKYKNPDLYCGGTQQ